MFVPLWTSFQTLLPQLPPQLLESLMLIFTIVMGLSLGVGLLMFGMTLLIIGGMFLQGMIQAVSRILTVHFLTPVFFRLTVWAKRH